MSTTPEAPSAERHEVRPRRIILTVVLCCATVALLVWQRQKLAGLPQTLAHARWEWIVAAIIAEVTSIGAVAREQRRLISVRGGTRSLPSVLATTWAGNAISMSLPLIGSATATVFIYKRFTAIGVERAEAAWALAISGVYSTVTFTAMTVIGALVSGSTGLAITGIVTAAAFVVPVFLVLAGVRRPRVQTAAAAVIAWGVRLLQRLVRRPKGNAEEMGASIMRQLASLRLGLRSTVLVTVAATFNWVLDLACLTFAILALHGAVPWHGLILAWAAGNGVSSLGLTPGGLGVVEITLGAALLAAGLPAGIAVASALLYRAIKLGLILAVGGITLLVIRRPGASAT